MSFMIGFGQNAGNVNMIDVLQSLGLTTNLKLCLDAGDSASYGGTSQTWTDRSGGGYDFFRGTTSGAEGSDPTFNGVAGNQSSSEYFSVDGGDWFTLGQANPIWLQSFHKAGAQFTICQIVYLNNITTTTPTAITIGDNGGSGSVTGFAMVISGSLLRAANFSVANAGVSVYAKRSVATLNNNAWNFVALSVDMIGGNVIYNINGVSETYSGQSYSSPSAGSASFTAQIAAPGNGASPDATGERWADVVLWSSALTAAQMGALFTAVQGKFGI